MSEHDPNYVAQLYMVMKGCERELKKMGFGGDNQPNIPVGQHSFNGKSLLINVEGTVERSNEGTAGDGKDWYVPTVRGLNLNAMCLALHRTGFNHIQTAEVIGDSIHASLTGEVEKAKFAVPDVVEDRKQQILDELRSNSTRRATKAVIKPKSGCFLNIERVVS